MNAKPNDYLPDPFLQGIEYRHKLVPGNTIWAIDMDTSFAVHTDMGLENRPSGDFLCKESVTKKMWSVQRLTFFANYERVETDDAPPAREVLTPAAARSENET